MRQTHTFVVLEISAAAFFEIKAKLEAAGYQHTFNRGKTEIDMTGIAVSAAPTLVEYKVKSECD